MTTHTPTPWKLERRFGDVSGPSGKVHAILTEVTPADRELIVRAVNSHGVLRDALREMVAVFGSDDPGMRGPVEQMARAALAKAGEA